MIKLFNSLTEVFMLSAHVYQYDATSSISSKHICIYTYIYTHIPGVNPFPRR